MSNSKVYEELDNVVTAFIADPKLDVASYVSTQELHSELHELLEVATQLDCVARPAFKAQLRQDLLDEAFVSDAMRDLASYVSTGEHNGNGDRNGNGLTRVPTENLTVLPSLFGLEAANSAQRRNFAASMLLHSAVIGALVASSAWMAQRETLIERIAGVGSHGAVYVSDPPLEMQQNGGGSGGDRSKLAASKGEPPKFAEEQFTPPIVVPRNAAPELPVAPTVLGQQQQKLPQFSRLGDPLSNVSPTSNGTGGNTGIGEDMGTGVGWGKGPGAGLGSDGGTGGGVFRIGGAVRAPRAIYSPDPEYSEEARRVKHQGTVILWGVIGADGLPRELRVARALGMGLDQKALEAVRRWRFEPAMKDGQPVAVQVNIEVNFRLH